MKLNVGGFGLAVGIVVAAAFTICAFFVALAPEATADFIGYLLHIDLSGLARPISWGSTLLAFSESVSGRLYGLLLQQRYTMFGFRDERQYRDDFKSAWSYGANVRLNFDPQESETCSELVLIPAFNKRSALQFTDVLSPTLPQLCQNYLLVCWKIE
jgi:hypothetical protein